MHFIFSLLIILSSLVNMTFLESPSPSPSNSQPKQLERNFVSYFLLRQQQRHQDDSNVAAGDRLFVNPIDEGSLTSFLQYSRDSLSRSTQPVVNCSRIVSEFTRRRQSISNPSTTAPQIPVTSSSSGASIVEIEKILSSLCESLVNLPCRPSPRDLLSFQSRYFGGPNVTMVDSVSNMCPVFLAKDAFSPFYSGGNFFCTDNPKLTPRPSTLMVWSMGFLSVTVISLTSVVGVLIIPFLNETSYLNVLNIFEGLAVGSLVSSAIFHLIPQAFDLWTSGNKHDYLWKAMWIFVGIYLFYWSERIMKMISAASERQQERERHEALASRAAKYTASKLNQKELTSSSQSEEEKDGTAILDVSHTSTANGHIILSEKKSSGSESDSQETNLSGGDRGRRQRSHSTVSRVSIQERARRMSTSYQTQYHPHGGGAHNHTHFASLSGSSSGKRKIATVAWMIIFGDGLHNFIDGLSIGAAFNESILTGFSICLAVVCEEFPHELGDFAVLLASGMSVKEAVAYNFLSACTCYLGMILGIIFGDFGPTYIFALAGGMFLYISLVDMMSELTAAVDAAAKESTKKTLHVLFLQNIGILIGVVSLFLLAKYSEYIDISPST